MIGFNIVQFPFANAVSKGAGSQTGLFDHGRAMFDQPTKAAPGAMKAEKNRDTSVTISRRIERWWDAISGR
jgi:hypothetical protein